MMTVTFEGARAAFRDSPIRNCASWSGGHAARNDGVLSVPLFQTCAKNGIARSTTGGVGMTKAVLGIIGGCAAFTLPGLRNAREGGITTPPAGQSARRR